MSDEKDQTTPSTPEERARKQARARSLTDPLGAMGFRDTRTRYRREARARRAIFGGAAASFVVGTALIVAASNNGADSAPLNEGATTTAQESTSGPAQPVTGKSIETLAKAKLVLGVTVGGTGGAEVVSNQSAVPTAVIPSYTSSDDHEDGDHEGEHDDGHEDDDEHEYSYSVPAQPQPATSSDNQTVDRSSITVTQPPPHTRTNSTGS